MENNKLDVIDWLNDIVNDDDWLWYYSNSEVQLLAKDALELLKAQEPRIMTLEEVCVAVQKNATLFTECEKENQWVTEGMAHFSDLALFNDPKYDNCKITFIRHTYDGTQKNEWYVFLKNYNKTWRCWTFQPTEEQQEEIKWNE